MFVNVGDIIVLKDCHTIEMYGLVIWLRIICYCYNYPIMNEHTFSHTEMMFNGYFIRIYLYMRFCCWCKINLLIIYHYYIIAFTIIIIQWITSWTIGLLCNLCYLPPLHCIFAYFYVLNLIAVWIFCLKNINLQINGCLLYGSLYACTPMWKFSIKITKSHYTIIILIFV